MNTPSSVIAAYLRLSRPDGDLNTKDESNSISNQRKLIEQYLLTHPDLADMKYMEYIDDGYTGTNTARPSFQRMLHKARIGEIQCIIVKDMSRLSRDYLTLGDYVEQIFPMQGIRFIAVNDGYDSREQSAYLQSMSISLQGLFYDYYSRDLSRKRSISNLERMKNGFLPQNAPFGYRTNPTRQQYEPDPEAAVIVRLIFDLVLAEYGLAEIVNMLNEAQIPTPNTYNTLHPELHKPAIASTKPKPVWKKLQISRIIQNPVYKGTLETNKTHSSLSEHIHTYQLPKEEHIIHEDAHTPLISKDDFDKAGRLIRLRPDWKGPWGKGNMQKSFYLLKGTLRCGHCGFYMYYIKNKLSVMCSHYYLEQTKCSKTKYSLPVIEDYVYYELRTIFQQSIIEKGKQEASVRQAKKELKDCQKKIVALQRQQETVLQSKRKLFESFSFGEITQSVFFSRKEVLQHSADEIQAKISDLENKETALSSVAVSLSLFSFAEKAEYYLTEGALTRDMVTDYVAEIRIYGPDDYRITWRYPELFDMLHQKAVEKKGLKEIQHMKIKKSLV